MSNPELTRAYEAAQALSFSDKLRLIEQLIAGMRQQQEAPTDTSANSDDDTEPFTEQEIEEMLTPKPARSGKALVEQGLKSGAIGSWEDKGITDPVEWLAQQRAKQRAKHKW